MNKIMPKQNKKERCVNSDCRYQNSLDVSNIEKYGKCKNCEGYEHFNCANIQENKRKEICLKGSKDYLCTECLTRYPTLALELIDIAPVDHIEALVQEVTTEALNEVLEENSAFSLREV